MLMMLPPLYRVTRANNISRYNIKQTGRKILIVSRVFIRTYQRILYIIVIHMETYTHTHNRPLCDVRTRIININAIRTCAAALPSLKSWRRHRCRRRVSSRQFCFVLLFLIFFFHPTVATPNGFHHNAPTERLFYLASPRAFLSLFPPPSRFFPTRFKYTYTTTRKANIYIPIPTNNFNSWDSYYIGVLRYFKNMRRDWGWPAHFLRLTIIRTPTC